MSNLLQRFWARVDTSGDCWVWKGSTSKAGYGTISDGDRKNVRQYLTHRLSFEIHKGKIPSGAMVLHDCDNPPCVNPDHLHCGDHRMNAREMVDRGRSHRLKIYPETRAEIIRRRLAGERQVDLAREYGIHPATVKAYMKKHRTEVLVNNIQLLGGRESQGGDFE